MQIYQDISLPTCKYDVNLESLHPELKMAIDLIILASILMISGGGGMLNHSFNDECSPYNLLIVMQTL